MDGIAFAQTLQCLAADAANSNDRYPAVCGHGGIRSLKSSTIRILIVASPCDHLLRIGCVVTILRAGHLSFPESLDQLPHFHGHSLEIMIERSLLYGAADQSYPV
jgi:hypothetical protein